MKPLFADLLEKFRLSREKRRLKDAFRRKPKPARVIPPKMPSDIFKDTL